MIILSLDSGVERTGYAVFNVTASSKEDIDYITSGLIETKKENNFELRLLQIYNKVLKLIVKHHPKVFVFEQIFFFKNQKTVVKVSQAQGAILLLAAQHKIKVEFLTPLQIKQIITGYGNSDKKSVQKMLRLSYGFDQEVVQDDQADAIACGLAYCHLNKSLLK